MANVFNTMKDAPGVVAKAAAKLLADELQFCKSISKADESDYNGKNGYGAGETIYISKPARFIPQGTFDITSTQQDIVEEKTPLTLNVISTIGINVTSEQFASEIALKSMIQRVIKPAVSSIAQDVEGTFLEKATDATFNVVGTAGSTVYDTDTVLSAKEKMSKFLCPKDDKRYFLTDSTASRSAVNARKGLFQSSDEISKQYKMGYIGTADGFHWMENELLNVHTNGNDVTGAAIDDTVATGASTIHIDGITTGTGTVLKGQVFTIDGVFAVHPITKTPYPFLQQFVVTEDVTASGTSDADVKISPTIYGPTSDGLQNVSALPANDAPIVFVGAASTAYTQNLAFHEEAFRMVSVPLIMPTKAEMAAQETYKGVTIAIIRDWDQLTRKMVTRLDFLGGIAAVRPEWACRITS